MAPAPNDDLFGQFLIDHGHETEPVYWDRSYDKLQCLDCGALCNMDTAACSVRGQVSEIRHVRTD